MLAKHGIRHDTTVILYGRDVYAAARVAQIMLYAGVKDVRLLDGGWKKLVRRESAGRARYARRRKKAVTDFGAPIPGQPQLMLNTEQARGLLHRRGCVAGQRPFVAGIYRHHQRLQLHQAEGAILPAPAGAMPAAIPPIWKTSIIRTAPCAAPTISRRCGNSGTFCPTSRVSFYCGTGWRASETFMYARAMGWKKTSPFMTAAGTNGAVIRKNPVATGERGPDSSK